METAIKEKFRKLTEIIDACSSGIVAFSGGVDSSLLLKVAHDRLGDKLLAVTVATGFSLRKELDEAKKFTSSHGINHELVTLDVLKEPLIISNPEDRCYHCKLLIFKSIKDLAEKKNFNTIMEGSNCDDTFDYRPGTRAIEELSIKSPLKEAGLTKDEIRFFSKKFNLRTWNIPSSSCLATRIPYGREITQNALARVEDAETIIREAGIHQVRVRDHGDTARIEIPKENIRDFIHDKFIDTIVVKIKSLGYTYVTLDLEGYRTGSMNESLRRR